jgi:hypothetical protein
MTNFKKSYYVDRLSGSSRLTENVNRLDEKTQPDNATETSRATATDRPFIIVALVIGV